MILVDDLFARTSLSGLGLSPSGIPWTQIVGSSSVASNTATFTSGARSIAVLGLSADGTFTWRPSTTGEFGAACYFRVTDANNWWRMSLHQKSYAYNYISGYNCTRNVADITWLNADGSLAQTNYINYEATVDFYSATDVTETHDVPTFPVYQQPSKQYVTTCQPIYSSGIEVSRYVLLEKCVNGGLQTTYTSLASSAATYTVTCAGSSITISDGTTSLATSDTFNQAAIYAGVGVDERSEYAASSIKFAEFTASYSPSGDSDGILLG